MVSNHIPPIYGLMVNRRTNIGFAGGNAGFPSNFRRRRQKAPRQHQTRTCKLQHLPLSIKIIMCYYSGKSLLLKSTASEKLIDSNRVRGNMKNMKCLRRRRTFWFWPNLCLTCLFFFFCFFFAFGLHLLSSLSIDCANSFIWCCSADHAFVAPKFILNQWQQQYNVRIIAIWFIENDRFLARRFVNMRM